MRYLLFAGDNYYANGGWEDFKDMSDNLETLIARITRNPTKKRLEINKERVDWLHIVDLEKQDICYTDNAKWKEGRMYG